MFKELIPFKQEDSIGVIFDFDGVIINSSELQKRALLESYKLIMGYGKPSIDEFFSHSGESLENIFKKMNLPQEMVRPYRSICRQGINEIILNEGMKEFIAALKENDHKCGICTGKERIRTIEILQHFDIFSFFDVIVCSDDVNKPKPDPESLLIAMKTLGMNRNQLVMVGDAKNDILCAKSAGVRSVAVTWGEYAFSVEELVMPDHIAHTVIELAECIFSP